MANDIGTALPEHHAKRVVWTLLGLTVLVGMGVDLIAPSLPAIANGLHVPNSAAKNIIAIYLLGYAFGNFFTGFLTDAWGRQKIIRISLFLFVIVSLLPVFFPSMDIILISRILQGITLGSYAVVARSVFSDILPPEKLTRMGTLIGTMWGLGPVLGPVIGGYLQFYFGWEAGFIFFSIIAFIGFIASFIIIPETHFNRHPLRLKTIKTNLIAVISNPLFMCIVVLMGLAYSLIIVFNTAGPFLIQNEFHYSPIFFGHVALWLGVVFLISTFACRHFLKKHSVEKLYLFVIHFFFIMTIASIISSFFFEKNIILIIITSALMYFSTGFIFPMSMGKGLSLFRHISGTATALMYLINVLITSLVSFIVSFIEVHNNTSLICMYSALLFCAVIVYWIMPRVKQKELP